MLRSGWCNYRDAYVVVKETITVAGNTLNNWSNKKLRINRTGKNVRKMFDLDHAYQKSITHP